KWKKLFQLSICSFFSPNAKEKPLRRIPQIHSEKAFILDALRRRFVLNDKPKSKPRRNVKIVKAGGAKEVKISKAETDPAIDLDGKSDDPQMCGAYASDIYEYLHSMEIEAKRRPLSNYLEKIQKDVTANMRGVLIDWLVEVAEEYMLLLDTLYLIVSDIDKLLSCNALNRQKRQLLGVSSMDMPHCSNSGRCYTL
ncbi:cyclin-A3-2-like, partial [Salvia miltiorrhiza]|uniref:cyclin-A3-2-like n=1 Tax=Salvia miltiorrhiza TaxID=226208 RepID=UPI0025ABC5CF